MTVSNPRPDDAAMGLRVKSGWATAVLVAGTVESPQALDRRTIDLCDPAIADSRQPYHAAMGRLETDETKIARRRTVVLEASNRSVTELLEDYRESGYRIRSACLVVGSELDPARVTNPHIRAHALEGRLFREALESALRSRDLPCSVIAERKLYTRAAEVLRRSEAELRRLVTELGRSLGRPWRADEKASTLAAWLALV
jgi:hypothetical protein